MMAKQKPTWRQLEVLRAYIAAGSVAAAAYELGIRETTVRQHLSGLHRRTGCVNGARAAYVLGARRLGLGAVVSPRASWTARLVLGAWSEGYPSMSRAAARC